MTRRSLVAFGVVLCLGCGASDTGDHAEWLRVLSSKKAAAAPNATPQEKQLYADSLAAFVQKHPTHSRAKTVYERIQIDFARDLAAIGRYQDAIHFYRTVLGRDPQNAEALRGLNEALEHLAVSREKIASLEKGMSQKDVARILGKPVPGWIVHSDRRDSAIESWYYRTSDGHVAGVYFHDGELFAAEADSQARLTPLAGTAH